MEDFCWHDHLENYDEIEDIESLFDMENDPLTEEAELELNEIEIDIEEEIGFNLEEKDLINLTDEQIEYINNIL